MWTKQDWAHDVFGAEWKDKGRRDAGFHRRKDYVICFYCYLNMGVPFLRDLLSRDLPLCDLRNDRQILYPHFPSSLKMKTPKVTCATATLISRKTWQRLFPVGVLLSPVPRVLLKSTLCMRAAHSAHLLHLSWRVLSIHPALPDSSLSWGAKRLELHKLLPLCKSYSYTREWPQSLT